jgi:hypothetical protein
MPGKLVVKVNDASGAPVRAPTFTESGRSLTASCGEDAGATCPSGWTLELLPQGPHTIVVGATELSSKTISVTIQGPAGCCGQGPEVDETVTLAPSCTPYAACTKEGATCVVRPSCGYPPSITCTCTSSIWSCPPACI